MYDIQPSPVLLDVFFRVGSPPVTPTRGSMKVSANVSEAAKGKRYLWVDDRNQFSAKVVPCSRYP